MQTGDRRARPAVGTNGLGRWSTVSVTEERRDDAQEVSRAKAEKAKGLHALPKSWRGEGMQHGGFLPLPCSLLSGNAHF